MKNSNIKDVYSLAPAQEGIFAQSFLNDTAKSYHLHSLARISKAVDLTLFEKSVGLLSLRHPVLKTAFTVLKSTGAIKQVILENRKPEFTVVTLDEPFSEDALDKIIGEESKKSFDLQRDSLFRVVIADFEDDRFMFVRAHHIILDGWCLPVIIGDLQRYYGELSEGKSEAELSDEICEEASSQTSYAQYVNWIKKQDKNEAVEYWKNLLSNNSITHIFGKEKKDNIKNDDIITLKTPLDRELTRRIEQFARKIKVSYNTVFEGAFSIALQKYSGSDDVVYDKVISGRSIALKNIEKTVGLFINTVPVRISIEGDSTLATLLNKTQKQTVDANKHGILPLAEIYRAGEIDSRTVDALFVFENYFTGDVSEIENGPLSFKTISFDEQTEFNLTVTILKENDGYAIRTSFAMDLYTETEINDFIRGYIHILETSLDEIKLIKDISVADMSVIDTFNSTSHNYDITEDSTLYSLFEKKAKANKNKVCIKTSEKSLTFGELWSISEKVDVKIREITEDKKSVIAVIAERSAEMYASVYGIIRGGNAYLPIDPDYPQERIEYILRNSGAKAVAAQGKYISNVKNIPCIDITELLNSNAETEVPLCRAEPDNTAYVIYTSGSTGNPKGAKVSHKSAVNRILWMHDKYPLKSDDVILQKTPYTFDVSVWELFWWGICGGCLAASKPGEHFLPAKILDEVYKNNVTHLHFVPSVFELFLNYLEEHKEESCKFNTVKYVFLSGEALAASLVQRFYKIFDYKKVTLHNLYGPTECAVDVTYYNCVPDDVDPVPIGKPIYNTQMYVVDKYMNAVPVGVTGELCIAGRNVGQGYLNNPELTCEKFIDNPFGEGKLYKTGDLAYFRADGNIIFCGRGDGQIKLNGQRIELGEIEAAISSVDGIVSVAVTVKQISGDDTLVAFYTGEEKESSAIREICVLKLPRYMVPSVFVHLDALPLNQSGKLDRKALSQREIRVPEEKQDESPLNQTEIFVCNAFKKILSIKNVGRNSDFFEMGGTSLSMISLLGEKGFENITPAEFMKNPTPALLSTVMKSGKKRKTVYLEPLYISDEEEKVLILLPFAGGGAETYSNLVKSMKKKNDRISVYFLRYLHSFKECEGAAEEIGDVLGGADLFVYSHCVGSAVALQVIKCLENQNVAIKKYFAAASIPPVKAIKKNLWNIVSDGILKTILIKAGADISDLSDEKLNHMLGNFRQDTNFANVGFAEFKGKIKTPVSVIVSKKDIFTKNYRQALPLWKRYADNVDQVYYIGSDSHYFHSESSEQLTEFIAEKMV